ncbi:MAG: nucleotidyltransferase domain-containing protein [Euryarchaeota archaeon]|nr:nucleotidyltransferase domain-containing protein [Euryarchaeota archaeon]
MESIIGTKTAIKILSHLLKNPEKEFKESELLKNCDVGKGAGAEAINRLSSSNILKLKKVGKTKIISLNAIHPVAFSLRVLFDRYRYLSLPQSKISAISLLREKVYDPSKAIVLFGSLAAGTSGEDSDIDILVITDNEKEINKARKEVSEYTAEKTNVHFIKPHDAKKEFRDNDMIRAVLISGIIIYGGDYVREIMMQPEELKELKFLKERINAAWRNYTNRDYESAKEIISTVSEDMAFMACKLEGMEALYRKDALSKIKKSNKYGVLGEIDKLKLEDMLEVLEDLYIKLFNKLILKGEGIER